MPIQDAMKVKEKIITFIRLRGPSLPVQIARETGLSILFSSAFLSELYGEKEVSLSNLRVGSSPLYFIPGQEPQLERFSHYLKSKEKEAFLILKEKKFLRDSGLQPAIRVALREIKDFAIPFRKDEEIYWRYFTTPENEFKQDISEQEAENKVKEQKIEIIDEDKSPGSEEKKIENIFEDSKEISLETEEHADEEIEEAEEPAKKERPKQNKAKKQNKNKKKDENFFNKIKEFLEKKKIEILDIKDFKNDEAILKIKREKEDEEELLFVFNKKKITEQEILKSNKKASENKMKYSILSLSETPKKLNDLIEAIKNLTEIDKMHE